MNAPQQPSPNPVVHRGSSFLAFIEERFAFPISRWFWHLIVASALLALVASLALLIFSVSPIIAKKVIKDSYPSNVSLTADDLRQCDVSGANATTTETSAQPVGRYASFAPLEALIPPDKFAWASQGYWQEGYYSRDWILSDYGITVPLRSCLDDVASSDTIAQHRIIEGLAAIITPFPEESRKPVVQSSIFWVAKTATSPVSVSDVITVLTATAAHLGPAGDKSLFAKVAEFGKANPKDGVRFTESANLLFSAQQPAHYAGLFEIGKGWFANQFTENADIFGDATKLYVLLPAESRVDPIKSLPCFYRIFIDKFNKRHEIVGRIDERYQAAAEKAESEHSAKVQSRNKLRFTSLIVLGGSLASIAFFSLMLVLLAIQRSMRKLVEIANQGGEQQ
jgi:hypothetical protein